MLYLDLFKWFVGRCVLFACISILAMAVFLAYAYVPPILSQATDQRNEIERLHTQKESTLSNLQSQKDRYREIKSAIRRLEEKQETGVLNRIKNWTIGWVLDTTIPELKQLRQQRYDCVRQYASLEKELISIEDALVANQTGAYKFFAALRSAWLRSRGWIVWIALLIIFGPFISRLIKLGSAIVGLPRVRSLQFGDAVTQTSFEAGESKRKVSVPLRLGVPLVVRADWIEERDERIRERGRWFWRLRSPAISYTAGLIGCSVIEPRHSDQPGAELRLSAPGANDYLTVIEMKPEQSVCLRPRAIVGLSDTVTVRSHWRIASLHAWLFGQLRYLVFEGPGTAVIVGSGGVEATPVGSSRTRVAIDRVVGFEPQLRLATVVSGNYRSYLFGKTPLVEAVLVGHGKVVRRLALPAKSDNLVTRTLGGFLSAVGKILGF
ncbi:MAG: AIM24 family protein [Rubripirellula sp.]